MSLDFNFNQVGTAHPTFRMLRSPQYIQFQQEHREEV